MSKALTTTLSDHEATIEHGLKTFVDVGNALAAIRDGKLYKAEHGTFEDYCKVRWGWNSSRARQICGAADVVARIETVKNLTPPAVESHAAPLQKLPPDEQADAWEEVTAEAEATGEKITAAKVERVVAKRRGEQVVVDADTGEVVEPDAAAKVAKQEPSQSMPSRPFSKTIKIDPHDPGWTASQLKTHFGKKFCRTLSALLGDA